VKEFTDSETWQDAGTAAGDRPLKPSRWKGSRPAALTMADDADEVLITYQPYAGLERWLKYRFSAWSELKAWFVMTLVVLFFAFGGPGWVLRSLVNGLAGESASVAATAAAAQINALVLMVLMAAAATITVLAGANYLLQPTHLALGRDGFRFYWRRLGWCLGGPRTGWQNLRHLYVLRPSGKPSPQDWLLCFQTGDRQRIKVKLGAIPTAEQRAKLLEAIDEFAPAVTRAPEVMEVLSPPQDHSYTELWLQALSAPPKRERLTPLAEGASLQNGRYIVRGQLGVGGQGTAYLAGEYEDGRAESVVVLKESILPVYVDVNVRKQALEKFQKEATMLRRLDHAQVVKLRNFFVEDHRSYLVLEHIDGQSLRQLVHAGGSQSQEQVRELALKMCDILSYLHGLTPPVVHRDFTPDNLILASDGILKLVDFTVAHQSESTATGTVVGKHAYLPPEQFRGKPTPQSDIYALGATLYYLLTAEDPEPISTSHPILACKEVSAQMDNLVARATSVDTGLRYKDVVELRQDLSDMVESDGNI